MSDRYKLLDTRISQDKNDWGGERKLFSLKYLKNYKNDAFKYFDANWEQGNWSVFFKELLITLFVTWKNVYFFPLVWKFPKSQIIFKKKS